MKADRRHGGKVQQAAAFYTTWTLIASFTFRAVYPGGRLPV
jgi:hypothetical protein